MNTMKILLTGHHGQLGHELKRSLAPLGEIRAVDLADCNLADEAAIRTLVQQVRPQIIVNPAAHTAVDRAESEQALAFAINARAPAVLAEEAHRHHALLVHYSTDYVFDGRASAPYTETDAPNPLNVYGRTKLAGEEAILQSPAKALVLRTSWVVGSHGNNFARTMLRLAAEREQLRVVADQIGAPTSASLLADCTALLIQQWWLSDQGPDQGSFPYGLYHLTASGATSWHHYAVFVLEQAIKAGRRLNIAPSAIEAITTADYPTPAQRPLNSRLDCQRFHDTFGLRLPDWREGLEQILQSWLEDAHA